MKRVELLIIDPEDSFCRIVPQDQQQILHSGELCVPNAMDDMIRLGNFVKKRKKSLWGIKVTLDSHPYFHIAHPVWFKDEKGNHPSPFTIMKNDNGVIVGSDSKSYTCTIPSQQQWTLDYLRKLEEGKRYPHCIWPPHCLISTRGCTMVEPLFDALTEWCCATQATIDFLTKGSNPRVEHFSAVRAEVIDSLDYSTSLNTDFINLLSEADEILLTGEALNFCLANTARDIANEFNGGTLGTSDDFIKKCVLLSDCSSNVPGFEQLGDDFIKEMSLRGMRVCKSTEY